MEQELRNKVKECVKEYYREVFQKGKKLDYIPPSGKQLGEEELLNMIDASLDMWLTSGRFNKEFEEKFAKYLGVKYALSTNSGSSANLLALSALTSHKLGKKALKKGDEVITVAAGFPTTINPIIQLGLIPVFIDCEIGTYNIDVNKIEEAITEKTKAVFTAHTLGNPQDLNKIKELAKKYNLFLIEDSCDALGGEIEGKKLGTIGDIGTFSFYPAHHITMGEGGAVVTNNPQLYKIIKSFRDWGRDCSCPPGFDGICGKRFSQKLGNLPFGYDHKYTYSHLGYNLKITDWQASIGCAQINKIDNFIKIRTQNAQILTDSLSDLKDYLILPKTKSKSAWFGYLISVKENAPFTKQQLVEYMEQNKIGQHRGTFNNYDSDCNIETIISGKNGTYFGATSINSVSKDGQQEKIKAAVDIEKEGSDVYHVSFVRQERVKDQVYATNTGVIDGGYVKISADQETGDCILTLYENSNKDSNYLSVDIGKDTLLKDAIAQSVCHIAERIIVHQ